MRALFSKYLREEAGSITVEASILVPMLLFFMLPVFDLGLQVHSKQKMDKAADSGIEYLVNGGRNETTLRSIVQDAFGQALSTNDLTITGNCGCITDGSTIVIPDGEELPYTPDPYTSYYVKTSTTLSDDMCPVDCDGGRKPSALVEVSVTYNVNGVLHDQVLESRMQARIQ